MARRPVIIAVFVALNVLYVLLALTWESKYFRRDTRFVLRSWVASPSMAHAEGSSSHERRIEWKELGAREAQRKDWVVFLRIPRTGSTFFSESVEVGSHGCGCGWGACKCQTQSSAAVHGIPCSQMTCIEECERKGCRAFWKDVPHADWLEIYRAFLRARIPGNRVMMMTMLRDPLARVLSEYKWVSNGVPNNCGSGAGVEERFAWDYRLPCDATFRSFLDDERAASRAHNRQTTMLAGLADFEVSDLYDDEDAMLQVAKRHLLEMPWFGIHERMEESLWLLQHSSEAMGMELNITLSDFRRGTGSSVSMLSEADRKEVLDANDLDAKLYAFAADLFEKRLRAAREGKMLLSHSIFDIGGPPVRRIARCASGSCSDPEDQWDAQGEGAQRDVVEFGESLKDAGLLSDRPECSFPQTFESHIGTFKWYNRMFGCAFGYDWYRKTTFELQTTWQGDGATIGRGDHPLRAGPMVASSAVQNGSRPLRELYFSSRSTFAFPTLWQGRYVVLFGAAQSMGIQSSEPYFAHLEQQLGLPVLPIAFGGMGAGFYADLLERRAHTETGHAVRELVRGARVVVVQAMSGRSQSNSVCRVRCNNMYCENGVPFEATVSALGEETRARVLVESKAEWVMDHQQLIKLSASTRAPDVQRSVVFLYQSQVALARRNPFVFPQYVDAQMVDEVRSVLPGLSTQDGVGRGIFVDAVLEHEDPERHVPLSGRRCIPHVECDSRGANACPMEHLENRCECGYLDINYYPTPRLQWATGHRLANALVKEAIPASESYGKRLHTSASESATLQFFMLLTKGTADTKTRTPLVALESACKHHPGAVFNIYTMVGGGVEIGDDLARGMLDHGGCRIVRLVFDPATFFMGTPLEGWIANSLEWISKHGNWYSHSTDLFRSAALWRFGGWYLDTDVIVVKPLSGLRNCVAEQGGEDHAINNAISHFERGHAGLEAVMAHIRDNYNPEDWVSAGPGAITQVLSWWPLKNCDDDPNCITVLPARAFFPLFFTEDLVGAPLSDEAEQSVLKDSYAVHLWNKLSSRTGLVPGSLLARAYEANCLLCTLRLPRGKFSTDGSPIPLAIVSMIKNDADIVDEWIEHHAAEGVSKFYLIDDGSEDDIRAVLEPHLESGLVELFEVLMPFTAKERHDPYWRPQVLTVSQVVKTLSRHVEWAALIDTDEYLWAPANMKITDVLQSVPDTVSEVRVLWEMYGSSGHIAQPRRIRESFVRREECKAGDMPHTKSLVRPHSLDTWYVHYASLKEGAGISVTSDLVTQVGLSHFAQNWGAPGYLRLNHYQLMSRDRFFRVKRARGDVNNLNLDRDNKYFDSSDAPRNSVVDTSLVEKSKACHATPALRGGETIGILSTNASASSVVDAVARMASTDLHYRMVSADITRGGEAKPWTKIFPSAIPRAVVLLQTDGKHLEKLLAFCLAKLEQGFSFCSASDVGWIALSSVLGELSTSALALLGPHQPPQGSCATDDGPETAWRFGGAEGGGVLSWPVAEPVFVSPPAAHPAYYNCHLWTPWYWQSYCEGVAGMITAMKRSSDQAWPASVSGFAGASEEPLACSLLANVSSGTNGSVPITKNASHAEATALPARAAVTKFVVFSLQHSGSTRLTSALKGDERISIDAMQPLQMDDGRLPSSIEWPELREALDLAFSNSARLSPGASAVGLRITYDLVPAHLLQPFVQYIKACDVQVIHLVREATVMSFSSALMAASDGARHAAGKSPAIGSAALVSFPLQSLRGIVDLLEMQSKGVQEWLEAALGPSNYLFVGYETLLQGESGTFYELLRRLALTPAAPTGALSVLRPSKCSAGIAAYAAVKKVLEGTRTMEVCDGLEGSS